ncbi:hypothetical protein [Mucilaginibacter antarcticus]|uniref:hypothetical protein n=1 Tax=Mucilaginibacter antarcticus TaxID=1855725 RepID=UPI003631AF30
MDNQDSVALKFKLDAPNNLGISSTAQVKLQPGEIMPVVHSYQINKAIQLAWAPIRIYSITPQGNTTTILLSAEAGTTAKLYFLYKAWHQPARNKTS